MSFREQVAADIEAVFLNASEFAEIHQIDNVECLAVVSNDTTSNIKRTLGGPRVTDGLHGDYATVAVKKADLPRVPVQGNNLRLDGKLFKVASCTEDMGMLNILLVGNRMGVMG
jgi:hypothetical protein